MTAAFTPLHELLSSRTRTGDNVIFRIPEDWLQGRTAYGGLTAAIAAQAMRDVAGADWPPDVRLRSLQTNFVGPVLTGAAEVSVRLLREGKSVRQVQASVTSLGQVSAMLVGVYGSARQTALSPLAPRQGAVRCTADDAPTRPFVPGLMPSFLQHFAFGWAEGDLPYSAGKRWDNSLYVRLLGDHADRIDKDLVTVLLADTPPSPAMGRFGKPVPASSVSWALELQPLDSPVGADDWWRIDSQARSAADGYVSHSSTLWTATGEAAAFGHQVVTVYG